MSNTAPVENEHSADAQNATTDDNNSNVGFFDSYALLDFDPLDDGSYLLDTKGRARIHLRITADVADAIRIIPTELIDVANAGISA